MRLQFNNTTKKLASPLAGHFKPAVIALIFSVFLFQACTENEVDLDAVTGLDEQPMQVPRAGFTAEVDEDESRVLFTNTTTFSIDNDTDYLWDFGDGTTSGEESPQHVFEDGRYTVLLTATNSEGRFTETSSIFSFGEPFLVDIASPGFEEGADPWRNGDWGGNINTTGGPLHEGDAAGKLEPDGERAGYQVVTVLPNVTYEVSFFYTIEDKSTTTMTVAILTADSTPDNITELGSVTVDDQSTPSDYVAASFEFDAGANTEVAIYISSSVEDPSNGSACRIDNISIVEVL